MPHSPPFRNVGIVGLRYANPTCVLLTLTLILSHQGRGNEKPVYQDNEHPLQS